MASRPLMPKLFQMIAVILCAMLLAPPTQADLLLEPDNAPFEVARYAETTQVPLATITEDGIAHPDYPLDQVLAKAAAGEFAPVETRHIGSGLSAVANFVRIPIVSLDDAPQRWVLATNRAPGYFFQVHLVLDDGSDPEPPLFQFSSTRDQWTDEDVQLHTEFVMPPQSAGYLYVVYESLNGGSPMTIETVAGYAAKRKAQDLIFVAIVGITLGLVAVTVALMATLRRFVAVYYAGAVLSGLAVVLVSEHYVFAVFPQSRSWIDHDTALGYAGALTLAFALLFQRQFFADLGGTGRILSLLNLAFGPLCILSVVAVFKLQFVPPILIVLVFCVAVPLILVNGVAAVYRGYPGCWPFFLSAVILPVSFMVKALSYQFSSLLSSREASMILLNSIALEAMLLSLTLFLQVRHLRQEKEQALVEQVETAKANMRLAQSMSHAAHDIQQPLSSLRLALSSDAARDNREQDFHKAIDYLEAIVRRQLVDLGNAPLDDQGHADGPEADMVEPFELNIVLGNVAVMFADEAASKGLDLRVVGSTAITETNVFAVTRILSNLTANAIRNTDSGKVLIGCRRQAKAVCLDIYDTGKGFTEGEIATLMSPHNRNGDYPGSGLGLSIVETLCREHGFDLSLKSSPGAGAHFRVTLPKVRP